MSSIQGGDVNIYTLVYWDRKADMNPSFELSSIKWNERGFCHSLSLGAGLQEAAESQIWKILHAETQMLPRFLCFLGAWLAFLAGLMGINKPFQFLLYFTDLLCPRPAGAHEGGLQQAPHSTSGSRPSSIAVTSPRASPQACSGAGDPWPVQVSLRQEVLHMCPVMTAKH